MPRRPCVSASASRIHRAERRRPLRGGQGRLGGDGRIAVDSGATAVGQGGDDARSDLRRRARRVGRLLTVRASDTARLPAGGGTYASRSTIMAGSAVTAPRESSRTNPECRRCASGSGAADLTLSDGRVSVVGLPARDHALAEIARWSTAAARASATPRTAPTPSSRLSIREHRGMTTFAVHVAMVAVDIETAPCARCAISSAATSAARSTRAWWRGSSTAASCSGWGTRSARRGVDAGGQLITGSLMDYGLPVAADCPAIDLVVLEHAPARSNPPE